jgi:hypothetical protein
MDHACEQMRVEVFVAKVLSFTFFAKKLSESRRSRPTLSDEGALGTNVTKIVNFYFTCHGERKMHNKQFDRVGQGRSPRFSPRLER